MTFADDLNQKSYTQEDINGLKKKYNRVHFTHFKPPQQVGGNKRVKVKTNNGYTFVSLVVAEEEGLEIIPQKRNKRRKERGGNS